MLSGVSDQRLAFFFPENMEKVKSENLIGISYASVSNIESAFIERIETGIEELDWMYGFTEIDGYDSIWGIPHKTISLWSGKSGTGKSRVAISLSKLLVEQGLRVLYFQGELPVENFVGHIKADPIKHRNLFLSEEVDLSSIVSVIYEARPDVVIVDSVNQIPEYQGRNGAKTIIDGDQLHIGLRTVCNDTDATIILIGQLNQDGTPKGGTSLPHLVDISFELEPIRNVKSDFVMKVGFKHRYGKKGTESIWRHSKSGCSCISENRLRDEDWINSHWIFLPPKKEVLAPIQEGEEVLVTSSEEWQFPIKPTFEDKLVQRACAVSAGRPDMIPQFTGAEKRKIFWNSFWTEIKKPRIFSKN